MTDDEIIKLLKEIDMCTHAYSNGMHIATTYDITKMRLFAKRVAAEKEAQMIGEGYRKCAEGQRTTQFCALLEEAVKAEREACAKVCEEIPLPEEATSLTHLPTIERCAAAIRARGEQEQNNGN